MTIKQLSVFLENKTGRINEVTKILARHSINMQAFSMAETTDFGILRLIVSEVDRAVEILREANFAVMLTDVVCLRCDNVAGSLSVILEQLAENQIFIEYMYAFAEGEQANVIIRPNDITRCVEVLSDCKCNVVKEF
ncbi:MAG: amino acid-binding protein [Alistipes sp.]|jgi:hypothetical protein|nr:amino acid-binding protein [Alistipes sp.]MBQ1981148.1 amino acid-binding protein [Alistipes sp.]MBQ2415567.1 amino acid-binding protein [Alistipes sp.]MBQ5623488.1 amino acid-binding protein [Alistipes sp.]MBQ5786285.1 amino acid-binding protein [Alistipes sp.]